MIVRTTPGSWQTILADLSLILFMVTASALANAPDAPLDPLAPRAAAPTPPLPAALPPPRAVAPSLQAEPVGVWREGPGAPALDRWLAEQARDPRLRVTIAVRHAGGDAAAALALAQRLALEAGPRGASARIVVEPGAHAGASVILGYDAEAGTAIASMSGSSAKEARP